MLDSPHKFNASYVFLNESLDIWKEVLDWERAHGFTGPKSMVWSKHEGKMYFYELIEKQNLAFIKAIPQNEHLPKSKYEVNRENLFHMAAKHAKTQAMIEALAPFLQHFFEHGINHATGRNTAGLNPMAQAIQANNTCFMDFHLKQITDKNTQPAGLSSSFLRDLYLIAPNQVQTDLYSFAKSKNLNKEMLARLYDAGAPLFSTLSAFELTEEFKILHPDQNPLEAPYTSPALFRAALVGNESSSSRSFSGKLAGSLHYWRLLFQAIIAYKNAAPLKMKFFHALLDAVDTPPASRDPDQQRLILLDELLFLLTAEEEFAKAQQAKNESSLLNQVQMGFKSLNEYNVSHHATAWQALFFLTALGIYITSLVALSQVNRDLRSEYLSKQQTLRDNCNENIDCSVSIRHWDCCTSTNGTQVLNSTQWCEIWPEEYDECSDLAELLHQTFVGTVFFGLFGLPATYVAVLCAFTVLGIFGAGVLLPPLNTLFKSRRFTAENQDAVHGVLKILLNELREKSPTLAHQAMLDAPDLIFIGKELHNLNHEEFMRAFRAMEITLADYPFQATVLSSIEKIPEEILQQQIDTLKAFRNPPTRNLLRFLPTSLGMGSINENVDLEDGRKPNETTRLFS